jgi:hypothetical protein
MTMTIPLMPDVERMCTDHLVADVNVSARVAGELPENPPADLIVVSRVGGVTPEPRWLDVASIQVDARGSTKKDAGDTARAAEKSLMEMVGTQPGGGVVTRVWSAIGLQWLPDDETGTPRYVFQVAVTAHP